MKVTLPKPPSINHIYGYSAKGGFARSYITKKGNLWFEEAGYIVKAAWGPRPPLEGPIGVEIHLFTCRRQDIDNILKPVLDLLQKQSVLKNDDQIVTLVVGKFKVKQAEEKVEVEVKEYPRVSSVEM